MAFSKKWLSTTAIAIVAVGLVVLGGSGFLQRHEATNNPEPVIPSEPTTHSVDKPDETPPTEACEDYQVQAHEPRMIELPSLSKSGCIQKVGVDQNDRIAVPSNIHTAGWFIDSPLPGEPGVSIIDGHVSGRYAEPIFADLEQLKIGEKIRVQLGDKSWREFEVASIDSYPVEEAAKEQFKALDGVDRQLTLITCGGNFQSESQSFDRRIIVRTKLL